MKSSFLPLACLIATSVSFSAWAADAPALSSADKTFVMKAAQGGMTEVELGKLASEQAASPDVKSFGSQMVTDHGKADSELMSIAQSKNIPLDGKLDATHQAMVDRMSKMSGEAFDKAYVSGMVKAHKADDALFTKEAKSGTDADLKAFASKTDEVVKSHLSMIEDIQGKMKK